jgi:molecular chaperone DnaK
VAPGIEGFALRVPIVQGEFPLAHLCRLVGTLEIPSRDVKATLPAGAQIEVTLELDRGGRLAASARVGALEQLFDQVAHLVAPHVPAPELAARAEALHARRDALRGDALKRGMGAYLITKLAPIDALLEDLGREIELARGGDPDAAEKARRSLLEIDGGMAEIDADLAWPALEAEVRAQTAGAMGWLSRYGTDDEQRMARETTAALEKARIAKDAREVQRQLRIIQNLGTAAYYRWPDAWENELRFAESRASESTNVRRAMELVREGRRAVDKSDRAGLERAVRELWKLMPADAEERRLGHSSGVR